MVGSCCFCSIHLCIGSVYAWSIFNPALIKAIGVVTSSADDWALKEVVWIYSTAIVFLGLAAAFAGTWLEKVGPRMVGLVAAYCWGGGFLIGSVGIINHQLWLIYLGYGVLGGCGLGLGYVSPVSTLIRWFPDRRGMATGLAIMGFGGGAFFGARIKDFFIQYYYRAPELLSNISESDLITQAGKRFTETAEGLKEVVRRERDQDIILEESPGFDSMGNGEVERQIQEVQGQIRATKVNLEANYNNNI